MIGGANYRCFGTHIREAYHMLTGDQTTAVKWDNCPYCGLLHVGATVCPRIVRIEYFQNGAVKSVELRP